MHFELLKETMGWLAYVRAVVGGGVAQRLKKRQDY